MINKETIEKLIGRAKDDELFRTMLYDGLKTFREYHQSIYEMEIKLAVHTANEMGREEWQNMYTQLDESRRRCHNAVIASVRMLNRMADQEGLTPVYANTVSEEKPFRREIANAVIEFVETIVKERR